MRIHLDPLGGIAGDMFIAAIVDAFPELAKGLLAALYTLEVPSDIHVAVLDHRDGTFVGRRFAVTGTDGVSQQMPQHKSTLTHPHNHPAGSGLQHAHGHHHRTLREIRSNLNRAPLAKTVREHALGIFSVLANAEARVHGVTPNEVTFHEVGAWDSIIDIVGAAYLIDALKAERWSIDALPSGSGRVPSAHGILPVPAPATVLLLEGFKVFNDGIPGERVTPTGAAIVRYLVRDITTRTQPSTLTRVGTGFGTRIMPGLSNILRVIVFESETSAVGEESLGVIQFEVDDQSPEDLAIALERLRGMPGVRDVLQMAAYGKKGRMISHIRILADPQATTEIRNTCFAETTTLGVRCDLTQRFSLERNSATAEVDGHVIGVKLAHRPDGSVTAKAEAEDLKRADGCRHARESLKVQAEQQALERNKASGNDNADA